MLIADEVKNFALSERRYLVAVLTMSVKQAINLHLTIK